MYEHRLSTARMIYSREKQRVSFGNGFYYWELVNENILQAQETLKMMVEAFADKLIDLNDLKDCIRRYFAIVFIESEKEWFKYLENCRTKVGEISKLPKEYIRTTKEIREENSKEIKTYTGDKTYVYEGKKSDKYGKAFSKPKREDAKIPRRKKRSSAQS